MKKISILFLALALAMTLAACEKDGPMEETGEKIDRSVEKTKDKIQDTFDPRGPAEKAGEKIDETVEDVRD
ncbi:MAG: hypothetical protein RBR06_02615 [Desulfuromonadaceae bacterium]|nr:hypothetical protein [Desulfuromonadaceae bacterium]